MAAWKTGAFSGAVGAALPIQLPQRTPAGSQRLHASRSRPIGSSRHALANQTRRPAAPARPPQRDLCPSHTDRTRPRISSSSRPTEPRSPDRHEPPGRLQSSTVPERGIGRIRCSVAGLPHWPVSHATAGRTRRTLMHAPCGATLRRSPPAYRSLRVLDCAGQPARLPPGFPNPRVGRLPPSSRAIRARSRATKSRHAVRSRATSPAAPRRLSSSRSTIVHPRTVRAAQACRTI